MKEEKRKLLVIVMKYSFMKVKNKDTHYTNFRLIVCLFMPFFIFCSNGNEY